MSVAIFASTKRQKRNKSNPPKNVPDHKIILDCLRFMFSFIFVSCLCFYFSLLISSPSPLVPLAAFLPQSPFFSFSFFHPLQCVDIGISGEQNEEATIPDKLTPMCQHGLVGLVRRFIDVDSQPLMLRPGGGSSGIAPPGPELLPEPIPQLKEERESDIERADVFSDNVGGLQGPGGESTPMVFFFLVILISQEAQTVDSMCKRDVVRVSRNASLVKGHKLYVFSVRYCEKKNIYDIR